MLFLALLLHLLQVTGPAGRSLVAPKPTPATSLSYELRPTFTPTAMPHSRGTSPPLSLLQTTSPTPTTYPTHTPTPSPTPTSTFTPTPTPPLPPTDTLTPSPTPSATPTGIPTRTHTPLPPHTPSPPASPPAIKRERSPSPTPTPYLSTKPWPPPTSDPPTHYWLARPFTPPAQVWASPYYPYGSDGEGRYLVHHGADFPNPEGTLILAGDTGTVVFSGRDDVQLLGPWLNFYGQAVVIRLDRQYKGQDIYALYGHIRRALVQVGERVQRGQPIAEVGQEGIALGPHLHLEVRLGANTYISTVNPEFWLVPMPGHGTLIGRLEKEDGRVWQGARIRVYRVRDDKPTYWTTIPTYLSEAGIQPDPLWGENWALTDVPEGTYLLETEVGSKTFRETLTLKAGQTRYLHWVTP